MIKLNCCGKWDICTIDCLIVPVLNIPSKKCEQCQQELPLNEFKVDEDFCYECWEYIQENNNEL